MERKWKRALRRALTATGILGLLAATAINLRAEEAPAKDWSVAVGSDVFNKYVWRGILINNDPVAQPSATVSWKGLSLNVWGNVDMTDYMNDNVYGDANNDCGPGRLSEVDYTLSYTHAIGNLSLTGGYIYYQFTNQPLEDTQELFLTAALTDCVPFGIVPTLSLYKDIDQTDGLYANLGLSKAIALHDRVTLDLSAGLGWGNANNNEYYFFATADDNEVEQNAFLDASVGAKLTMTLTDSLSAAASVRYTDFVDQDVNDWCDRNALNSKSGQTVFGVNLTYTF